MLFFAALYKLPCTLESKNAKQHGVCVRVCERESSTSVEEGKWDAGKPLTPVSLSSLLLTAVLLCNVIDHSRMC